MKTKIKEALKQKYSNLGLGDEVFERVASSVETFITDEAQIANFVDGAESMLKQYQSIADKARGEASAAKQKADELAAQLKALQDGNGNGDADKQAKIIADAVAAAIKPISDELAALKGQSSAKEATNTAHAAFFGNDYAKKYTDEANDAWERAMELNSATGSKMTAEELQAKAQSYFTKAVSRKGVDTSKPFEADKHLEAEGTLDWSAEKKRKQEQGKIAAEQ